jgi:hypothetical protein
MSNITAKLAEAYAQVNENQQMANKKALAKAAASSEKGKAAVTLPKAPWDKEKTEMSSKEKMKKGLYNSKMDPVDKKELKGKHADRDDKDIDNDGDTDSSDEYLHNRRKAVSKAMSKEGHYKDLEIKKQDKKLGAKPVNKGGVEMNPVKKKDNSAANADQMESTIPSVYARILENRAAHYKKAAPAQDKEDGMAPMTKKAKADMEAGAKVDDTEEKGHADASKAGRAGPRAKARAGDNMKGDKSVMNPVKDTTG